MKRNIISIDQERCTGCGKCIPDCPEGALQIVDGKARLVSDLFCDGLGACIGTCPEGAISITEREAGPYDEKAVMATIVPQGPSVIRAHLEHLAGHGQTDLYNQAIEFLIGNTIPIPDHTPPARRARKGPSDARPEPVVPAQGACPPGPDRAHPFAGCPGTAAQSIPRDERAPGLPPVRAPGQAPSRLRQWPVQLSLLNAAAPYFDNADLLIAADCVPFAYGGFHEDLLQGRILIIFCPKLDSDIEGYIAKLAEIFTRHTIRSITVARMEVPCCGGVRFVVDKALAQAGTRIPVQEITISIRGRVL